MHPQSVPGPVVWQLSDVQPLNTRPLCCFMLELARALDLFTGLGCVLQFAFYICLFGMCTYIHTHVPPQHLCGGLRTAFGS